MSKDGFTKVYWNDKDMKRMERRSIVFLLGLTVVCTVMVYCAIVVVSNVYAASALMSFGAAIGVSAIFNLAVAVYHLNRGYVRYTYYKSN